MLMAFIVPPRVVGRRAFSFVPSHSNEVDAKTLKDFSSLVQKGDLLVLTGAGISTESGIPDYRSDKVGLYATSKKKPIQHKDFMQNEDARRSYWARQ